MRIFNIKFLIYGIFLSLNFLSGCNSEKVSSDSKEIPSTPRSSPIRVSPPNVNASEPALTVDENGNVYAVYVEHNANQTADVYLQKLDVKGNIVGEKIRVNTEKEQAKTWFGDPPTIEIGKDKTIYVGWTARFDNKEKSSANILYLSVSRDGGASFDAPVKVNDDAAPAAHGMHSLAIGDDNRVYLAWLDERNLKSAARAEDYESAEQIAAEPEFQFIKAHHNSNQSNRTKIEKPTVKNEAAEPNSEIFYAVSSDGGRTFAPNRKLSSEVCPCCKTDLLAAPDGKIYVSWRQVLPNDFRHIAVATLIDGGTNFTAPVIVSDDQWQISACPVSGAPLTMTGDKTLKIAWFTAGNAGAPGIYTAESKDGGATFTPRVLIGENASGGTPVLLNEGDAAQIVWAEAEKIMTENFNLNESSPSSRREIGAGDLPAAAIYKGRIYSVFVKKNGEQRGVWLTVLNQ